MPLPPPRPSGTALVTGASSGIGKALAEELARRGYALTLVARRRGELERVAERLREYVEVVVTPADLARPADRQALSAELERRGVEVDILVNAAGSGRVGPVADGTADRDLTSVAVNVEATTELTARFVPGMVARGTGAVLHVSSMGGFSPIPGQAVYAATKAFVLHHGEALHHELLGTGVAVSVLCPGPVRTGFAAAAGISEEDLFAGLPDAAFHSPGEVARAGVEGLDRNVRVIVPGRYNQLISLVQAHAPHSVLLPASTRTTSASGGPTGAL